MAKVGPVKDNLEPKKKVTQQNPSASTSATAPKKEVVVEKKVKSDNKKGRKTITLTEKFSCRAKDLYEILMDENRWKGFTLSDAKIGKDVGGEFFIFNGSVTGTNVELQESKLIVQKWRFGKTSLKDDIMQLYQPVHLLVGTPGKILDLAKKVSAF
ncbi:hypothetical protein K1719_030100 [Acacia pycnantha]|nr:hypothetical protein K1719_030100 [Acacia pycnantha]